MSSSSSSAGIATAARPPGARRRSKSRMKLEMDELPAVELSSDSVASPLPPMVPIAVAAMDGRSSSSSLSDTAHELPGIEWKHEPMLRNAIHTLLQETSHDDSAFTFLRQICNETLARKHRASARGSAMGESLRGLDTAASSTRKSTIVSSTASECDESVLAAKTLLAAPKSPQERLLALVPNAIEKGKRTYQRRASPNTNLEESSRWQKLETDDMAPITDLTVIFTGDTVPDGFTKLERTPSGLRADLNKGGRGVFVYLCHRRDRSGDKLPISEIIAIFPERGEFVPTDYEVVQRRGAPANLNTGTQGEKIYLCYKRSATSSIVDVMVLFPKKGEKTPYSYMKVDRTPDGHLADLNMNSGGTEVCLCYKKKLSSLSEMHAKWLRSTLSTRDTSDSSALAPATPPSVHTAKTKAASSQAGAKAAKPPTGASPASKASEVRETNPASPTGAMASALTEPTYVAAATPDAPFTWQDAQEYYLFPLLLACYTRHGTAAEAALQGLAQCFDAGMFDDDTAAASCRLDVIVDAVASICHQGVKARFALALPFFRKVIRKCPYGFAPAVLHAILKTVIFIGDFDAALVKSVEDELVLKIMRQYEASRCDARGVPAHGATAAAAAARTTYAIALEFVEHLIDDVSAGVEIAKMTETMLGIFKSHASIHSPTFCTDFAAAMADSIDTVAERNALQLVITLSKAVHRKAMSASELNADRDHLAIVNSLRALNVALLATGPHTREHRVFGQAVRRFVVTTVNSIVLIWSTDVFRATLTLVSTLWNHYRRHLKVELALLFEHVFLRILRSNAACVADHQLDILHELTPWIQLPHNVVEIFLNFDLDRVQQWKIFEFFCSALCSLAEGSTQPNGLSTGTSSGGDDRDDEALHLQVQAIHAILAIARSVMDASGHAHLISRDARTRHLSMDHGGWEQDEGGEDDRSDTCSASLSTPLDLHVPPSATPASPLSAPSSPTGTRGSTVASDRANGSSNTRGPKFGSISVRMRNELQKRNQQFLKRAMEIASSKSLKKAIEYLVAMNFVKESPRDVTSFLRIYHDFFDEAEIGDYLGEGDEDFKVQVRLSYVRAISFKGMTLVESLRHFLTTGGFRLPGEAQKIERMVEAFAQCYWEDAPTSFSSADTAMIIAYSIIMLNTDLHNPQVKKNKMSKEQFVKNNRGIDSGRDLPRRFLEDIYDDIAHTPMHIKGARFVAATAPTSAKARETNSLELENEKFRVGLTKSVAQFDELLKDLSPSYYTFQFVGVDTCISPDLIKLLFERVWFYFLALSTSILCDNQSDLSMTMHCLDLLRFSISTCLFLDMPVERQAFCNLLFKVQSALDESALPDVPDDNERESSTHGSSSSELVLEPLSVVSSSTVALPSTLAAGVATAPRALAQATAHEASADETRMWIASIENAAATDDPWRVMGDIHLLVNKMKDTIQRQQKSEALSSVVKRINRSHLYIKGTTQFIREGDLTKKCRSRNQLYRFFLFSDQLLYADKSLSGYWNPHNSLRLKLTRIADVPDSVLHKHAFQIHNPEKSFIVYADSAYSKAEWMRLIEDAIAETAQKVKNNARRLSTQLNATTAPPPPLATPAITTAGALESHAAPLSPSAASVVASASSAMKVLMRRSSRLSSPTHGVALSSISAQCDEAPTAAATTTTTATLVQSTCTETAALATTDSTGAMTPQQHRTQAATGANDADGRLDAGCETPLAMPRLSPALMPALRAEASGGAASSELSELLLSPRRSNSSGNVQ